jgi:hypothetical protein
VVDDQLQAGMPFRDPGDHRQELRDEEGDGDARTLRRRPEPVDGAIGHPRLLVGAQEGVTEAEHAGTALPAVDQLAVLRLVELEAAHDREAVGVLARGVDGEVVRAGIPAGGMKQDRVHACFVHSFEDVVFRERGERAVHRENWAVIGPDVHLGVDDLHSRAPLV